MIRHAPIALAALVASATMSCSKTVHQQGGLELLLGTNLGNPTDYDSVQLEIEQQTTAADGGAYQQVYSHPYSVPSQLALPSTFAIAAGSSDDQFALIRLVGSKAGAPRVIREVLVDVPTDRVAELALVLDSSCYWQTMTVDGQPEPQCSSGNSCQPSTGQCGPDLVASSQLPTYHAGDEVDAGPPGDAGPPPVDAATEDAPTCDNACTPGATQCAPSGAGVETCVTSNGCSVWGAPTSCPADHTCEEQDGGSAACACSPGYALSGGACTIIAPQPISPLSTATATSQTPLFRWATNGLTGAQVDICRDRACATVVTTFPASGTSGQPATALAAGLYYWRLHGIAGGPVGTQTSAVRELYVGAGTTAQVNTSWGSKLDVNGDGFSDVVAGDSLDSHGSISVYEGGDAGSSLAPTTTIGSPSNAAIGSSVDSAGDVNGDGYDDVIVGTTETGVAYLFLGGPGGVASTPATTLSPNNPYFGSPVAGVGDVNLDGYADVVVGAPNTQNGPNNASSVYLYYGGPSGLVASPAATLTIPSGAGTNFGTAVAAAGDVNGDGYADVLVGASGGLSAYLYLGGQHGVAATPIILAASGAPTGFGFSLACAGDVNGDGFADVVVGSPPFPVGALDQMGSAYLYLGGQTPGPTMTAAATWTAPLDAVAGGSPSNTTDSFGISVAGAGDVNGDGFADVVVGSGQGSAGNPGNNVNTPPSAYVFLGSSPPPSMSGLQTPMPGYAGMYTAFFGGVARAGDVNDDGCDDVVLGGAQGMAGGVYVLLGTNSGSLELTDLQLDPPDGGSGGVWASSYACRSAPGKHPKRAAPRSRHP